MHVPLARRNVFEATLTACRITCLCGAWRATFCLTLKRLMFARAHATATHVASHPASMAVDANAMAGFADLNLYITSAALTLHLIIT